MFQTYYDINIENNYMRLFLRQSKTDITYIDQASGFALAAEFRVIVKITQKYVRTTKL